MQSWLHLIDQGEAVKKLHTRPTCRQAYLFIVGFIRRL